jgi:hypothetical protein
MAQPSFDIWMPSPSDSASRDWFLVFASAWFYLRNTLRDGSQDEAKSAAGRVARQLHTGGRSIELARALRGSARSSRHDALSELMREIDTDSVASHLTDRHASMEHRLARLDAAVAASTETIADTERRALWRMASQSGDITRREDSEELSCINPLGFFFSLLGNAISKKKW